MTTTHDPGSLLVVVGRGEATEGKRDRFDSAALAAIRYADPAAWITANAVANAIDPIRDAILAAREEVGIVVNCAEGPVEAIAAMTEASRGGFSSPIRFPASNPGSLGGLSSIAFGLRGPTMVLTMPAARGVPVALLLADAWLRRGVASFAVVASAGGLPATRCLVLAPPGAAIAGSPLDREADLAWLAAVPGKPAAEAR